MFSQRHHKLTVMISFLIMSVVLGVASLAQSNPRFASARDGGNWEYLGTEKSIVLKRKKISGSKLFVVRGETTIHNAIERVVGVLCDHSRWVEWTQSLTEARLLGRGKDGEKVVYQAFDMPAILSNRDVVYTFKVIRHDGYIEVVGRSRAGLPSPPTIGVRMNLVFGRWFLRPVGPNKTDLTMEVLMDPKGYLPSWFVNIVQRDYPIDTLTALRRQIRKRDIKALPPNFTSCEGL
jgi:hypothetical protein